MSSPEVPSFRTPGPPSSGVWRRCFGTSHQRGPTFLKRLTQVRWTATLDSRIRVYLGVTDVVDYLNRLVAEVAPPRKERPPTLTPSLALPEALDDLNVVWLVWHEVSSHREQPVRDWRKAWPQALELQRFRQRC